MKNKQHNPYLFLVGPSFIDKGIEGTSMAKILTHNNIQNSGIHKKRIGSKHQMLFIY